LPGMLPWRDRGLPGYLTVLFVRATVHDPAGCAAASPAMAVATRAAFRIGKIPGCVSATKALTQDGYVAWLCDPRLGTLAYLRAERSALLQTTSWRASTAMLPPPQQGSLPACRARLWPDGARTRRTAPEFHGVTAYSPPFGSGLAWSLLPGIPPSRSTASRRRSSRLPGASRWADIPDIPGTGTINCIEGNCPRNSTGIA